MLHSIPEKKHQSIMNVSEGNLSSVPYFDGLRFYGVKSEHLYTVSVHADMVKIKARKPATAPKNLTKRQAVTGFSRKSRKRMIELLADEIRVPDLFVTLTFSDDTYSPCIDTYKACLEAFRRRLERAYEGISVIWKMELEKRKSGDYEGLYLPHFHLIIWLPDDYKKSHELIVEKNEKHHWAQWWHDITGSNHPEHLARRGCDISIIKSRRHGYYYVSKYAAKTADDKFAVGRRWGRFGTVGQGSRADIIINGDTYRELKRLIASYVRKRKKWAGKKLSRQNINLGLTAFGLGVWTSTDFKVSESTIYQMVNHAREVAGWRDDERSRFAQGVSHL